MKYKIQSGRSLGTSATVTAIIRNPIAHNRTLAAITELNVSETALVLSRSTAIRRVAVMLNPYSVSVTKYQMKDCAKAIRPKRSGLRTRERYGSVSSGNI